MTTNDEIAALKAATRQAHETIQELRTVIREARDLLNQLGPAAEAAVDEHLAPVVEKSLEDWAEHSTKFINQAEERINARFDQIADILLGETKRDRRRGEPTLSEYAEHIAARRQP